MRPRWEPRQRGYDVVYREFAGGHDLICWEHALPEALTTLLGA